MEPSALVSTGATGGKDGLSGIQGGFACFAECRRILYGGCHLRGGPTVKGISRRQAEYRRAFKVMTQERADAIIVSDQAEHGTNSQLIIELAEQSRLPAIFHNIRKRLERLNLIDEPAYFFQRW